MKPAHPPRRQVEQIDTVMLLAVRVAQLRTWALQEYGQPPAMVEVGSGTHTELLRSGWTGTNPAVRADSPSLVAATVEVLCIPVVVRAEYPSTSWKIVGPDGGTVDEGELPN